MRVIEMGLVEVEETVRKKVTVRKKTYLNESDGVILAIPKRGRQLEEDEDE